MSYFAIRIGLLYRVVEADDETGAIEYLYDSLGIEWVSVDDLVVDAIRPATVRETMRAEFGERWELESHQFSVVNSYRTEGIDVLVINGARGHDVHGYDEVTDLANYRVLYEEWSGLESDVLVTSTYSNVDTIGLKLDSEAPSDLVDVLKALSDYPVLDDQVFLAVEEEEIEDHWESYGRDDVLDAVARAIGADSRTDLTDEAEDLVKQLVFTGVLDYGDRDGYPSFIDCSAVDFGVEAVAAYVRDNIGKVITLDDEHLRLKYVNGSVTDPDNWERVRTVIDLSIKLIES